MAHSSELPFEDFGAIYAFGDSLTDTGREPAEPFLHFDGRWSNGPLWIEYLSGKLGLPYVATNNYAHSGAQVDDMISQAAEFKPSAHPERALFVAWAGGNDFTQTYEKNWIDDTKWEAQIQHAMTNYFQLIATLHEKGARTILVPNTVDLSQIPLLNHLPVFVRDYLRGKVRHFNDSLARVLDGIGSTRPDLRLIRVDAYDQLEQILTNPGNYGFTETKTDVLGDFFLFDKRFTGPGRNYIFWDPIHPTTKAHALIADWFVAALKTSEPLKLRLKRLAKGFELVSGPLQPGQAYRIERSPNLIDWSVFSFFTAVTNVSLTTIQVDDAPSAIFRIR